MDEKTAANQKLLKSAREQYGEEEKTLGAVNMSHGERRTSKSIRSLVITMTGAIMCLTSVLLYIACLSITPVASIAIKPADLPSQVKLDPSNETRPISAEHASEPDRNIFHLHGELTHYKPATAGWGVDEYPLPTEAHVAWVNVISRHGARYPTPFYGVADFARKHASLADSVDFTDDLSFLQDWTYDLGVEELVPLGKQEMFDSGTSHYNAYRHLVPTDGTRVLARTTTQPRMLESAEYFLAGFFGLDWKRNVTLQQSVEDYGQVTNSTLAGWSNCPQFWTFSSIGGLGRVAMHGWNDIYLAAATERFAKQAPGFNWTIADSYNAQSLCAFETVGLGRSRFCDLFTYEEWEGFEYAADIRFSGNFAFQCPVSRGLGIGLAQELVARLDGHLITKPSGQVNTTIDGSEETFPVNQKLYLDFSHDATIIATMVAMGFVQFAKYLDPTFLDRDREFIMGKVAPFAMRLDVEVIESQTTVPARRNMTTESPRISPISQSSSAASSSSSDPTRYIRFILNERTLPLHKSFKACEYRDDGWCELQTWLSTQKHALRDSMYEYACHGEWERGPYGSFDDGTPVRRGA